jgi:hypothetical protein
MDELPKEKLDASFVAAVAEAFRERRELKEWREDVEESFRIVMDGPPEDEKHCNCVPFLLERIKLLERGIQAIYEVWRRTDLGYEPDRVDLANAFESLRSRLINKRFYWK